ncbi:MAG: hypothetical protein QM582_15780 [Micropruina sp.]|uniref:hypothetical protein n=1 Tax=Micropruina sp. TaxID=2737536 RepID=UPI0039E4FCD2
MNRRLLRVVVASVLSALLATGCSGPIPREPVPEGWALNVHQPGEWWTQPLIPRSVVVQRCPPPAGWSSEPDLSRMEALPPGIDVNYSFWNDDYHCLIGWAQPVGEVPNDPVDGATEAGLRRICSTSGLPMDAGWRFLGHSLTGRPHDRSARPATAAFIDEHGTVVGCLVGYDSLNETLSASVELSVGADLPATPSGAACPVKPRDLARSSAGTVEEYRLRGAGAVRGTDGRVLASAATLRIGLAGDSVTTEHPVVDGVAIVDASVQPTASIPLDWDNLPALEGQIYDAAGNLLGNCRS